MKAKVTSSHCVTRFLEESASIGRSPRLSRAASRSGLFCAPLFAGLKASLSEKALFNKTISTLSWHPLDRELLILGSKNGDLSLRKIRSHQETERRSRRWQTVNHLDLEERHHWRGRGRGSTITAIRFDPNDSRYVFTSSVCGKIVKRGLDGLTNEVVKDSSNIDSASVVSLIGDVPVNELEEDQDLDFRFSALDVNEDKKVLIAGDNNGIIHLIPSDKARSAESYAAPSRVHLGHILHCEFNAVNSNTFVTSSLDKTVKLWDLRMFSCHKITSVAVIRQENSVNSATFNPTNGSWLLTTDNENQLNLYRSPHWLLEQRVPHPHRQYQQLAVIKASWHPNLDLALVGSSSSREDDQPTVDIINMHSGEIVQQLSDCKPGIMSVNVFNCTGDIVASARGAELVVWRREED